MIGIVDYGLGNLASVAGAVDYLGAEPVVTADVETLFQCSKLILPGVGAFGDGMAQLAARGLIDPLHRLVLDQEKPILGICLGFQLLAKSSPEFGLHAGLGWLDQEIIPLDDAGATLRVPHVGWNAVHQDQECVLFDDIADASLFYFVHSFAMEDGPHCVGHCAYGQNIPAVVQKGHIYGTQFHPEKSQRAGLQLLKNFLEKT